MVPLPSHSPALCRITQWGQLGEILGGVKGPERGASRGSVTPPTAWEVVSNRASSEMSKTAGPLPQKELTPLNTFGAAPFLKTIAAKICWI